MTKNWKILIWLGICVLLVLIIGKQYSFKTGDLNRGPVLGLLGEKGFKDLCSQLGGKYYNCGNTCGRIPNSNGEIDIICTMQCEPPVCAFKYGIEKKTKKSR